jgi:hypothetical protein
MLSKANKQIPNNSNDMLSIQLTKGCKCLKTLVCSFLLHRFPLYLKVFYRTRRASRQND